MDNLFFLASKLLRPLLYPSTWLLLTALLIAFCHHRGWHKLRRRLTLSLTAVLLLIGFYPVGNWLAYPLEQAHPQPPADAPAPAGIIVLGGAWLTDTADYWQQWELNHAAERDIALIVLARRYPNAQLLFSGGSGRLLRADIKEADLAAQLYRDMGLPSDDLLLEADSRNTFENAEFSTALVPHARSQNWWLITSAYHMPRALGAFCRQGWLLQPYPVDHFFQGFSPWPRWALADHLWELERVSQEWLGLLVYRLTGRYRIPSSGCNSVSGYDPAL